MDVGERIVKLHRYRVQTSRSDALEFFNVPRVDYDLLLDTLRYPVIWAFDPLLENYLPSESDYAFIRWLGSMEQEIDPVAIGQVRVRQLQRHSLVEPPERLSIDHLRGELNNFGWVIIPQLVSGEYCHTFMPNYYWRNDHLIERHPDMDGIIRTSVNNLPPARLLHQLSESLVQKLVDEPIKTSYSFTSAYEAGSTLPPHTDRSQCVYNISLMLGSIPYRARLSDWPLHIRRGGEDHHVGLEAGDAVLYSGTRDLHWRDRLPKHLISVLGVFFHYVPESFQGSLD